MYSYDEVYATTLDYFSGDELATNVFFKYALKNKDGKFLELTPDQMHRRLAKEFARIESKYPNPLSEDYIYSFFKNFKYICAQGSPMAGIGNDYQHLSLSNCIVIAPPQDSVSGIFDTGKDMANLFKRRCGVGTDISTLRPDGMNVSNAAGTTSGAWSFADFYSYICRMIGQFGRRGALMVSMDVRHPDILKFIKMKHDLTKVTGANVSVKLTDDFMRAVEEDREYLQCWPIDQQIAQVSKNVRAKEVWDAIVESATKTAEPGLLFWDNIINNLPAHGYPTFETSSTNPCSELPLSAYDSCRLISINLKHLAKNPFKNEEFDWDKFNEIVPVAMRLSDDLVDLELEKIDNILSIVDTEDERSLWNKMRVSCANGRRTGLGTHGLADMLARMCCRYDSGEAVEHVESIYQFLKETAYATSIDLAQERGTFPVFDWKLEKDNNFIKNLPLIHQEAIEEHGRRNISILTIAPTGSVSILSQCSSGIEPVFELCYTRRRKRNHDEEGQNTDFIDNMGDKWEEFQVYHHNYKEYLDHYTGNDFDLEDIPDYFITASKVDWKQRIAIQSVAQQHIDHSISSTLNLPKGTTPEVVGNIYKEAWKRGLKGVTVYVDGSRSGVLIKKEDSEFAYKDAPDRSEELECDIHTASIKGEKWIILVGLMGDRPYEVFGGLSENIEIPLKYKKGTIIKVTNNKSCANRYDLRLNGLKIKNIIKMFDNTMYQVHTRMVSLGLRHGAKPSFLVEQLLKDPDNDLTSFSKVLARVLKKYIENGTKVTGGGDRVCPECSVDNLIYQEGCVTCTNCGWSRCS